MGFEPWQVTFPSPVATAHEENNTVHAEYYRPKGAGPFPAVIVLDILGGDQTLSRLQSTVLAQHGVAALFVQMPYYGPRRPNGKNVRLLSLNVEHSVEAVRQTVLDLRRATAWLEAQPEVNPNRIGIMGTSLGSFMAALTCEMEPKLHRAAILLGGGGLVEAYANHPDFWPLRLAGGLLKNQKEKLAERIAPADPITLAARLRERDVLMIGARRDEVVPPKAMENLWVAAGKPRILWYDCTHAGAAIYAVPALQEVIAHFGKP
jgi:dienelactone hydrolase